MNKYKVIIVLLMLLLSTGCYNYHELNELAITSALAIDKVDDKYLITIQVINTQKQSSDNNTTGNNAKFTLYEGAGKTVQEAARRISLKSPKKTYLNHMQLLVISEEVAKEGISDILEFQLRNPEMREQYNVVISKGSSAKEALELITPIETLNSKNIVNIIENTSVNYGSSSKNNLNDIFKAYLNNKMEIIIPSIETIKDNKNSDNNNNLKESDPSSEVVVSNIAVFKKEKLIGYLSEKESIGYNFITNSINRTVITDKCNNKDYFSVKLASSKTKLEPDVKNNTVKIKIKSTGSLGEINCNIDIQKEKNIKKLEKIINSNIEYLIKDTIKNVQEKYNSDIFGFADLFYKSNPKEFNKIKEDWYKSRFKNLKIEVNAEFNIETKGNSIKVIKDE